MLRRIGLMVTGLSLVLVSGASLHAQQYAWPDGVVGGTGNWVANNEGHWQDVGEGQPADDSDLIQSTVNPDSIEFTLTDTLVNPGVTSGHILKFRADNTNGKKAADITIALVEGGTTVGSNLISVPKGAGWAEYSYTIPAASVGVYNDLSIRITGAGNGQTPAIVSWIELEIPSPTAVAPTVINPQVISVLDTTAVLEGEVSDTGGVDVTERGVVWDLAANPDPTIDTNLGKAFENPTAPGTGTFQQTAGAVVPLDPQTDYKFRAYATNAAAQTGYSDPATPFTTTAAITEPILVAIPTVNTILARSAYLGGEVTGDGGDPGGVTERGTVWNTTGNPNIVDDAVRKTQQGSGLGAFEAQVTGLDPGVTIYFRAYAVNGKGTGYSDVRTFSTPVDLPVVDTPTVTSIDETSAVLGGWVRDEGGPPGTVTDRGTVWNTTGNPNIVDDAVNALQQGSGLGEFSHTRSGLPNEVLVYYRAYATNSAGTAYSEPDSFTPTTPPSAPVLDPDPTLGTVTHQSAVLGGEITSDGGQIITERGTVWAEAPTIPDINSNKAVEGGIAEGLFSHERAFPPGKTINFKAFATNSLGTTLTDNFGQFTTLTQPNVQATNAAVTKKSARGMRIAWTRGNGEGSIVVLRPTSGTTPVDPVDGSAYLANHLFPEAEEITPPVNSQNYVVYAGTNSYVDVGLLAQLTSYTAAVYEYTSSSGTWDYLLTDPATVTDLTTDVPVHNTDVGAECGECHGGHGGFHPSNTDQKAKCVSCHNATGDADTKLDFDLHTTPTDNPVLTYVDCGFCHELHNPGGGNTTWASSPIFGGPGYNKSYLRANVDKYVSTASPPAFLQDDTFDDADAANALTPERAVEGGNDTTARGYCQVCHTYTKYHRSTFTEVAGRPNAEDPAPNQCHDGEGRTGGPGDCINASPETHCGRCHRHANQFRGEGGSQTCIECHTSGPGNPVVPLFDLANSTSSHIDTGPVSELDCEVCHGAWGHGGKVGVIDADDGTLYVQPNELPPTTTGEGEVFAPHCLSCHDGSADLLAGGNPDQTPTSPFTNSGAPPLIDAANWSAAAHDRDSTTYFASPVTCVGDGTNGCHSSGHGTDSNFLLASAPAWPPGSNPSVFATDFCMNCHDGIWIDNPFSSPTDWQVDSAGGGGGKINQRHDVTSADQAYSSAGLTCKDCHSPHVDQASDHAAQQYAVQNPDNGDAIPPYSPGTYGGGNDPLNPVGKSGNGYTEPDMIEFCLVCHDNTPARGASMTGLVDIASAWQTNDQHGVPGPGNKPSGNGYLKYPFQAQGGTGEPGAYAALNCTTCHDAHGSGNIYNLRSSITVAGEVMEVGGWTGDTIGGTWESGGATARSGETEYFLPSDPAIVEQGQQNNFNWGAWCSFCHQMESHNRAESTDCSSGHMHGANAF